MFQRVIITLKLIILYINKKVISDRSNGENPKVKVIHHRVLKIILSYYLESQRLGMPTLSCRKKVGKWLGCKEVYIESERLFFIQSFYPYHLE